MILMMVLSKFQTTITMAMTISSSSLFPLWYNNKNHLRNLDSRTSKYNRWLNNNNNINNATKTGQRNQQSDEEPANSPRKRSAPSSEASKRTVQEIGKSSENNLSTASSSAERRWTSKISTATCNLPI